MSSGSTRPARRRSTSESSPAWGTARRGRSLGGRARRRRPRRRSRPRVTCPATDALHGIAGVDDQRRRRPLAQTEARCGVGAGGQIGGGRPAVGTAREIGADVHLVRVATVVEREQGVEAGDAVDLGGGDVEPFGDVVDRGRADPADAVVDGVQRRQQQMPARLVEMTAADDVQLARLLGARARTRRRPARRRSAVPPAS